MARPRVWRSIEWRTPEGDRLKTLPFLLPPVLSAQWSADGEIETVEEYDARVTTFVERRERVFAHVADAQRNLDLSIARYRAGEAQIIEVTDAQNTLASQRAASCGRASS